MRKTGAGIASNPVLVGGVTVLVVIVAVFLSYNANQGLPFVPTTQLKVRVPNGANLVPGNEIRSGGSRIGVIDDMKPVRAPDGKVEAELMLKLDKRIGDVPDGLDVPHPPALRARPEVPRARRGRAATGVRERRHGPRRPGQHVDGHRRGPEDVRRADARRPARRTCAASATRSPAAAVSLGRTIEELPRLLEHLQPVMTQPRRPGDATSTRFFTELADTAADRRAGLRAAAPRCSPRWPTRSRRSGRDEGALKETISKSPPTMDVAIESFRVQRPFLANLEGFGKDFAPATAELRGALPTLNRAIDKAIPVQRRAPELNEELGKTLDQLRELAAGARHAARRPRPRRDGHDAQPAAALLRPVRDGLQLAQLLLHLPGRALLRARHDRLRAARAAQHAPARRTTAVGSMGADEPANGENVEEGNAQFAQNQPYAAAITPDGQADCETGQRGWLERNAGGLDAKYRVNLNPRTPGAQGPTFKGAPRVPAGQTFTRHAGDRRLPRGSPPSEAEPRQVRAAKRLKPKSNVGVALLALAILLPLVYLGFTKSIPFRPQYEIKAVFESSNNLKKASPVRIAGVEVGSVTKVERVEQGGEAVVVTMRVGKAGRPIHDDARAKIRPRIFLEGNFFVDIEPGTPGAAEIEDGETIPINQTVGAGAVRPDPDVAAVRHARGPQDAARRVRQRARQGRRRGVQPLDPVLEERLPRHRDRQRGVARARPSTTSPATSRAPARRPRRWTATRPSSRA